MTFGVRIAGSVAAALSVLLVAVLSPFEGFNLWSLWQLEAAERFVRWRAAPSAETMRAAFAGDVMVFPLGGWLASLFATSPSGLVEVLRSVSLLAGVVVALAVWSMARRAGGCLAGAIAVTALVTTPRFATSIVSIAPTSLAVGAVALVAALTLRATRGGPWAWVLASAIALALGSSLVGWMSLAIVFWLLFVGVGAGREAAGTLRIRPATLGMLAAIPLGLLGLMAFAYFREDSADRISSMLLYWLTRGAEPFLYFGERFGAERIPVQAPAVLWSITMPFVTAVVMWLGLGVAVAAWRRGNTATAGDDDQLEALRHAKVWWLGAMLVPVVLRSPFHGGLDLLAFGVPFCAVLAGVGGAALLRTIAAATSRGGVVAIVGVLAIAVAALVDSAESLRRSEAYYNAAVGGADGAQRLGFSTAAHMHVPIETTQQALAAGSNVAILSNAWELRPVLESYARLGWIAVPTWTDPVAADVIVMHHDETLPETHTSRTLLPSASALGAEVAVERDGVRLLTFFRRP